MTIQIMQKYYVRFLKCSIKTPYSAAAYSAISKQQRSILIMASIKQAILRIFAPHGAGEAALWQSLLMKGQNSVSKDILCRICI